MMSLDLLLVRRWPERRAVILSTAAVGFAAVFAGARLGGDASPAIDVLHVLPVMLVALELGLAGGLAAAALATGLVFAGDALSVFTFSVAFLTAGAIAGRFSDRMRAARAREQRLLDSGLALSEVRTSTALAAAVAEAALRAPRVVGAAAAIDGHATATRGATGRRHTTTPILARGARIGTVTVVHDVALEPEDLAALELLALQAGLAADNQRLRGREREAAAVGAQLRSTRDQLREHRSELGHLLADQEDERRRVAEVLHEDLAQSLAGVLLGLRMLRREAPGDALEEVHGQIVGVLDDVRETATSLRPTALAQLGLVPALEALARQSGGRMSVSAERVPEPLPEPLRTGIYRLVEHAVAAGTAAPARLHVEAAGEYLDVHLELELDDPKRLVVAHSWVAVLGGSMQVEPLPAGRSRVRVRLPLHAVIEHPTA